MVSELTKQFIAGHVAPALKTLGFKKKVEVWNRPADYGMHVIEVQSSRERVDGTVNLTLNIGVLVSEVWLTCWDKPIPDLVREENCYPRFRLGHLLAGFDPKQRDRWWKLSDTTAPEACGREIRGYLENECESYFRKLTTVDAITTFVQKKITDQLPLDRIQRAILYSISGLTRESEELLAEVARGTYWRAKAEQVSERLRRNPASSHSNHAAHRIP